MSPVGGFGSYVWATLEDDVVIADNLAMRNGGGIHVSGYVALTMRGNGLAVHRNTASGVPSGDRVVDGQGGGLYVRHPADAWIRAKPFTRDDSPTAYPVFWFNRARQGGAMAVTGSGDIGGDAYVELSGHRGQQPMTLESNFASVAGGAIYLGAYQDTTSPGGGSVGFVCADDTLFRFNAAPDGAAVFASSADSFLEESAQGRFIANRCAGDHPRCDAGARCSGFEGNRTENLDTGVATQGAIIAFPGEGPGHLELHRARFEHNLAGSLVHVGDEDDNRVEISNCLVARNTLSKYVFDSDANETHIRHCTIVDNTLAGAHVMRLVESADARTSSLSTVTNSIVAQPGHLTLKHEGATGQTVIRYLLTNDASGLPVHASIVVGNPAFQNIGSGDYLPGPPSMALDFAPPAVPNEEDDGAAVDLLGRPRTVDLPARENIAGARDLGCCELQSLDDAPPPPGTGPIFGDGFETR